RILDIAVVGNKHIDSDKPLVVDDPFHIGSVAKTLTGTVIAQLVEDGKLAWDTPVAEVLPEVMETAREEFTGITLANLLAHEAGLKPMEEDEELAEVPELSGDVIARRLQFSKWVLQQAPTVTPGKDERYSNAHFVLAAAMAERAAGKSWEALITENVFTELGMRHSGFGWPGKDGEDVPWGHFFREGKFVLADPNGSYQLPQYFAPAGDIYASLPDMAKYFQAYLGAWRGEHEFLQQETLQHMWTRRIGSGLAWGVTEAFGHKPVTTYSGSADTFLMIVVLIPDADIGVAVAANAFSDDTEKAVIEALRAIVKHYVAPKEPSVESM
ncbi:MAG: beta-lactamase family protein, partial [Gammaproteobacteria bacterium]|nr:beta-lactamase family protein [Gammaproteobacteria bacterium]